MSFHLPGQALTDTFSSEDIHHRALASASESSRRDHVASVTLESRLFSEAPRIAAVFLELIVRGKLGRAVGAGVFVLQLVLGTRVAFEGVRVVSFEVAVVALKSDFGGGHHI